MNHQLKPLPPMSVSARATNLGDTSDAGRGDRRGRLSVHLRHRLLPQPHGFEGFAWVPEPLEARCLPFADRPDGAVSALDLSPAAATASPHCGYHRDALACVDEALDVHAEVSDCVVELVGDRRKGLDAYPGSTFEGIAWIDPLDIGVQQVRLRWGGAGSPARVNPADELHVLLRHRLLPQPHGFEGLSFLQEQPPFRDFPVLQGEQERELHLHLDAALPAAAALPGSNDDLVGRVSEYPDALDTVLIPLLRPERERLAHTGVSVLLHGGGVQQLGGLRDHDVLVEGPQDAFEVASAEGIEGPNNDLHVLLRHRLLRQPDGFEGPTQNRLLLGGDLLMGAAISVPRPARPGRARSSRHPSPPPRRLNSTSSPPRHRSPAGMGPARRRRPSRSAETPAARSAPAPSPTGPSGRPGPARRR